MKRTVLSVMFAVALFGWWGCDNTALPAIDGADAKVEAIDDAPSDSQNSDSITAQDTGEPAAPVASDDSKRDDNGTNIDDESDAPSNLRDEQPPPMTELKTPVDVELPMEVPACPSVQESLASMTQASYAIIVEYERGPGAFIPVTIGSSFAISPHRLASNAHVAEAVLENPYPVSRVVAVQSGTGTVFELHAVTIHPEYTGAPLTSPDVAIFEMRDAATGNLSVPRQGNSVQHIPSQSQCGPEASPSPGAASRFPSPALQAASTPIRRSIRIPPARTGHPPWS